jgi:hypothetical protein
MIQATKQPSSNVLKEMATMLVPSMIALSSTPLALQLHPSIEINEANQKVEVESTTPKAELDQNMRVINDGGKGGVANDGRKGDVGNDGKKGDVVDQPTNGDATKGVIGQVEGPTTIIMLN